MKMKTLKEIMEDALNLAGIVEVPRRQAVSEIVELYGSITPEISQKILENATQEKINAAQELMNAASEEFRNSIFNLRTKISNFLNEPSTDKKRHLLDSILKEMALMTDTEIQTWYAFEKKMMS